MPLYFAVVFVFLIFYTRYRAYLFLSMPFAASLVHMFNVGVPHGPGVLWSLAVEEHFYLLWPLLVYLLNRRNLTVLAVAIVVLTPIARGIAIARGMSIDDAVDCNSWFRFDGLALGGLLALWVRSPFFNRANSYRLAGLLLCLALLITVIGIPFGLLQRTPVRVALQYTQAQFPGTAFFLAALVNQGTVFTSLLRSSFARLSGNLRSHEYVLLMTQSETNWTRHVLSRMPRWRSERGR
jgi:peptidoglycan/LPS O-acetylase OafA/YrhL